MMPILLMAISFVATLAAFWQMGVAPNDCFRTAFLKATIIQAIFITVLTEYLSLSRAITFEFVSLAWSLFAVINCLIAILLIRKNRRVINIKEIKQQLCQKFFEQSLKNRILLIAIVLILGISLLTALISPPNNYDSLTYHLPRVMHWIQNRSVVHYPTNNLRQISFPPGANYIVMQLQILAGSDRFANLVQWLAFLGCILGTSLIAKTFAIKSQIITALVCASIPMAILQSTTTQTDLIVSFWLVCFTFFIFRTDNYSKIDIFWLAAAFGLAMVTKPTAIIFGTALLIVLGIRICRRFSWKAIWRSTTITATILILSLSLSLPTYWRNYLTFGSILGDDFGTRNEIIGLVPLVSNMLRNIGLNMPITEFWQLIESFHQYILSIDVNNPAITYGATIFDIHLFGTVLRTPNEDFASNPIHLILVIIAIFVLIIDAIKHQKNHWKILSLAGAIILQFLMFSGILKWQIWGNRLLLPALILAAPISGYFISDFLSKAMQKIIIYLLIVSSIIYSLTTVYHPLIPLPSSWTSVDISQSILRGERNYFYFRGNEEKRERYQEFSRLANQKQCQTVGLSIGKDDLEYLLWVTMAQESSPDFKIKHINVNNVSQSLPPEFPDSELCAIFPSK
ncbi:ArnT family glycosyltransferase [Aerosakkonemataceae cyanobacterium BLCC-F154]|uniref:ArnT family glycosyltransferase n=1 Tax=Floridaenema fluviatile BLCC-F154 TaxID=3153640 RepID=A0ABV4Y4Y0_9CYAN